MPRNPSPIKLTPKTRQKLDILGAEGNYAAILDKLSIFQTLFAFFKRKSIVTKVGKGPSSWYQIKANLNLDHIIRHLLGDHFPGLAPIWHGARGGATTPWFCLDIDSDKHSQTERSGKKQKDKSPFQQRLESALVALRRMGINTKDPNAVLQLRTPSGGAHLYVFLDGVYDISQILPILARAGLEQKPGHLEIFPNRSRGFRLPFGHLPNTPTKPTAWLEFINAYQDKKIRRFSLQYLNDNLNKHTSRWARQAVSIKAKVLPPPPTKGRLTARKNPQNTNPPAVSPIKSPAEVVALLETGITQQGTRNTILKQICANQIFIQGKSAEEAVPFITTWAMDPRHNSCDIQSDLQNNTTKVPAQIERMCNWYEKKRANNRPTPSKKATHQSLFSDPELWYIQAQIKHLPIDERKPLAIFLLHLLDFAKNYGTPTQDQGGYQVAPAVNAVIRKWSGCHHMHYKRWIELAIRLNLLEIVQKHWINPNGKGKARTYRLCIPVLVDCPLKFPLNQAIERVMNHSWPSESARDVFSKAKTQANRMEIYHANQRKSQSKQIPSSVSQQGTRRYLVGNPLQRLAGRQEFGGIPGRSPQKCPTKAGGAPFQTETPLGSPSRPFLGTPKRLQLKVQNFFQPKDPGTFIQTKN